MCPEEKKKKPNNNLLLSLLSIPSTLFDIEPKLFKNQFLYIPNFIDYSIILQISVENFTI